MRLQFVNGCLLYLNECVPDWSADTTDFNHLTQWAGYNTFTDILLHNCNFCLVTTWNIFVLTDKVMTSYLSKHSIYTDIATITSDNTCPIEGFGPLYCAWICFPPLAIFTLWIQTSSPMLTSVFEQFPSLSLLARATFSVFFYICFRALHQSQSFESVIINATMHWIVSLLTFCS